MLNQGKRIVWSVVCVIVCLAASFAYKVMLQPIQGSPGVTQLQDQPVSNALARQIATTDIPGLIVTIMLIVLFLIWISPFVKFIRTKMS